jgi:hypothetical protein
MTGDRGRISSRPTLVSEPGLGSDNESASIATSLIASLGQNLILTASTIAAVAKTENLTKEARKQILDGLRDLHSESERFTTMAYFLACPPLALAE